jgi:hypothetical protein
VETTSGLQRPQTVPNTCKNTSLAGEINVLEEQNALNTTVFLPLSVGTQPTLSIALGLGCHSGESTQQLCGQRQAGLLELSGGSRSPVPKHRAFGACSGSPVTTLEKHNTVMSDKG